MATEDEWQLDRTRFVADTRTSANGVRPSALTMELGPLAREFAALSRQLLTSGNLGELIEALVEATKRLIDGADVVSVTLRDEHGQFHTPAYTDRIGVQLDQAQYDTGEGPCVESARADGPASAHSADLRADHQWPRFAPTAADLGIRSVLAVALLPDAQPPRLSGALNIFSRRAHAFTPADLDTALLVATHGSLALAGTTAVALAELRATQLTEALRSRDVIGQAKGILMARRGISADEAFDILRRTSQQLNIKLAEIATTLADRHTDADLL